MGTLLPETAGGAADNDAARVAATGMGVRTKPQVMFLCPEAW